MNQCNGGYPTFPPSLWAYMLALLGISATGAIEGQC